MLCQALCTISKPSVNSNWSYSLETLNSGQNRRFFAPCELATWQMTLQNNWLLVLRYFKLFASFHSHLGIQTRVTVWKRSIWVKISVFCPVWPWYLTDDLKNNRADLLCYFKLCASYHSHWYIQTGVTVRKHPISVKIDHLFCSVWTWN